MLTINSCTSCLRVTYLDGSCPSSCPSSLRASFILWLNPRGKGIGRWCDWTTGSRGWDAWAEGRLPAESNVVWIPCLSFDDILKKDGAAFMSALWLSPVS